MNDKSNKIISNDLATNQGYRRFIYIASLIGSLLLIMFALIDGLFLKLYLNSLAETIGAIILFSIHRKEAKETIKPWLIIVGIFTIAIVIMIDIFTNYSPNGAIIWLAIVPFICVFFLEEKLGFIVSIILNMLFIAYSYTFLYF